MRGGVNYIRTVRAKFQVQTIGPQQTVNVNGEDKAVTTITLLPVYSGSEENEKFYALTPSGSIQLSTVNADAAAVFKQGQEYYIDFTPAE